MVEQLLSHRELGLLQYAVNHFQTYGRGAAPVSILAILRAAGSALRERIRCHPFSTRGSVSPRQVGADGSVGIWHETYVGSRSIRMSLRRRAQDGALAAAAEHVPAIGAKETGRDAARFSLKGEPAVALVRENLAPTLGRRAPQRAGISASTHSIRRRVRGSPTRARCPTFLRGRERYIANTGSV